MPRAARRLAEAVKVPVVVHPPLGAWPVIDGAAYHGLAGDFVGLIDPHSESDPVAVLVQFLVALGNAIGPGPYYLVDGADHGVNLFMALVGVSSHGRKGTSLGHVLRLMFEADPTWRTRNASGLSSGEGLIYGVRDAPDPSENADADRGVDDKRLFVKESELASVLQRLKREGNTLSAVVRDAWDRVDLQTLTKNSPMRATGAHISIIGHITKDELVRNLSATETANGFANRFLWVCAQRSKLLPDGGGDLDQKALSSLVSCVRSTLEFARERRQLRRSPEAGELWRKVYGDLTAGHPGLLGAVTSRAAPQVIRLSCLYALLDQTTVIKVEHLAAALAVWRYCEASAAYVFGTALGDPRADRIIGALRESEQGLTRTEISGLFQRNVFAHEISAALALLEEQKLASCSKERGGAGRPGERWIATGKGAGDAR